MKPYLPMSTTKRIVFFTGSGISKESGIETFRDAIAGLGNLWMNKSINQPYKK